MIWSKTLLADLMSVFTEPLEIRFIDLLAEPAERCCRWGRAVSERMGRADRFEAYTDRRKALEGAQAVMITLSTGGLDAMEQDIAIPEKYGVYATVGDTAGPGGWSRSIRNIPVFMEFARDFDELCPQAFIANYTNPMSALTQTMASLCRNPVAGFCHANFEILDLLQHICDLPDWSALAVEVAGMNHYTWVIRFSVNGKDGYTLLREKIGAGSMRDVCPQHSLDRLGISSGNDLFCEIYDAYKYVCYPADRHISEFLPYALANHPAITAGKDLNGDDVEMAGDWNIIRTAVSARRKGAANAAENMLDTSGDIQKSRETGSDMIRAYLYNKPFSDVVNTLNIGQIQDLPRGVAVETMCLVDGLGVHPVAVPGIPPQLVEMMRPQANFVQWIVNGMINRDRNMVISALHHDPSCSGLAPLKVARMAGELWEANKTFINW